MRRMAEIHTRTKKIFSFIPHRLAPALARREHFGEALLTHLANFTSQFKSRKNPYLMSTSEIVCLLMRGWA
jgi:hypothetical protein